MNDAKQCPWCQRWCLKDNACDYIFACGLETRGTFVKGAGCGRSWCWRCGLKYCSAIMTQQQVRNYLRRKIVMETVAVMNLVSNRRSTVLAGTVDIVGNAGRDFFYHYRWLRESSGLLTI